MTSPPAGRRRRATKPSSTTQHCLKKGLPTCNPSQHSWHTRKKKLSKAVYGTSHTISLQEARYVCEQGAGPDRLIVGSGQHGNVELSPEAAAYLKRRKCRVVLMPTPEVIKVWNQTKGSAIGLFHVTC